MKRFSIKRPLALLLCLLMTLSTLSAVLAIGVSAAPSEHSVQNGTGSREPVRVESTFSYRASVKAPITAFAINMPTWNKTDSSCTVSIYKWQGSYEATVAGQPIASKRFDPMVDGAANWVTFDEQPAGEYLFHVDDVSADVGVWANLGPADSKGFMYLGGTEQRGEPELRVRFSGTVEDPFGSCEASQDMLNKVPPYGNASSEGIYEMNESVGVRLHTAVPVSGMEVKFGTYHREDMAVTMSVYAWKGNYKDTVASAPVASGRTTLMDNQYAAVSFGKIPAGDYLFLTHELNALPALYVYGEANGFEGVVYMDGTTSEDVDNYPAIKLHFTAEAEDYFLPCSPGNDLPDGSHTTPPAYVIPEDSPIYTHEVMPDTWVFTDGLGRVSLTHADVGDLRTDKTLAMFYWTWHVGGAVGNPAVNTQELSEKYPDAMRDFDHPLWAELGTVIHFWNEPVYGYYRSDDGWVQRKQGELLANAGVDVVFTDNTNGIATWRNGYTSLMETWSDAMADGVKTPKVSFMLPFWDQKCTRTQVQSLYLDIFRAGRWPELWFYWDEKPMLMAMKDSFDPDASLSDKEISRFFTFRAGQPSYLIEETEYRNWGWLSMYPQEVYYKNEREMKQGQPEQITVGVAQNHDYKHHLLAAMSGNNITGRSYTTDFEDRFVKEGAEASKWGYNLAQQWEYALEVDPKVVFVTGWNEWKAGRYESWPDGKDNPAAVENAFPDQYNDEFSRDIEPTKGALQDHYYYQLVNFVRRYKGARPIPTPTASATIDLGGSIDQWNEVGPYYAAYVGNTEDRDAVGYGNVRYTETSGRNDIIGAKVARDGEFVWFLVECAENITPYTDSLWMNLYIDTDQESQGWNTFEFVVNKSAASEKTLVLERFTAADDYAKTEKVADVEYKAEGRYLTVKIAKSDLGLSGDDYTVNFAWTDNVHDEGDYGRFSGDILDFYISGDVAPGGRFKYSYISTAENAGEHGGADTAPAPVPSETADDPKPAKGGCKSSVGMGVCLTLVAMAAAVALKKRDA